MIALALLLLQAPDPRTLAEGERIFAQSCSVGYCHGVAGAAGRGPRLRGRSFERRYLEQVTRDGIPNSAMPGWKGKLSEPQIQAVVDYVASLAGASEQAPPANLMPPGTGPAALPSFQGPPAAAVGHALFFDAASDSRCGACHSLGGRGIAAGPDLSGIAKKSARELGEAIRAARSRHVLWVKAAGGDAFPALLAAQDAVWTKLYDLTTPPPVLRTFARAEVSLAPYQDWRHSDLARHLSDSQLEALATYIRWAVLGTK
ncbi:MAG: c-type cytochrome [Acidobacteria bacterium]|nr:c-type cytochrome [Acidobacteriota bacterium]